MTTPIFALKIDVDTEIGTRIGIPNLIEILKELEVPATFFLSLGPDNTGRAIKRIFRKGFLKKVSRTNVISNYGIRTLLNGVLLPGPHIGKKHHDLLKSIQDNGFDVGIHAYDHEKWQDNVSKMSFAEIQFEFQKALNEFHNIFGKACTAAAAPGWQANAKTLSVYDDANLNYASDCRGTYPFFPKIESTVFKTLQIPTTLPTLDELLGNPELPIEKLNEHYISLLKNDTPNIFTLHPELEGMRYREWFRSLLLKLKNHQVNFKTLNEIANDVLDNLPIPICEMLQGEIEGRSGKLALQSENKI